CLYSIRHENACGVRSSAVSGQPSLAVIIGKTLGHWASTGISNTDKEDSRHRSVNPFVSTRSFIWVPTAVIDAAPSMRNSISFCAKNDPLALEINRRMRECVRLV